MEDYKTKYEKAIEQAKKELQTCGSLDCDAARQIFRFFPELKESEDERIRKECIAAIKTAYVDGENRQKWIAWLEKQDQKKHEEELENAYKCADEVQYRRGYEDAKREFESQGEQNNKHLYDVIIALWDLLDKIDTFSDLQIDDTNPDNPFKKIEYIAQERHKFVKSDGYNLYIQGEQITDFKQSKQKPVWSEEDENAVKVLMNTIKKSEIIDSIIYTDSLKEKLFGWLKSLKERVQAQLKQEWTGYDEKAYEIALLDIDRSPSITKNDSIDWLKSLKNRVQPQPKQEWSEEDENMLQKAISTIMYALSIPIGKENDPCFAGSSTISWLKSLKERMKGE